MDGTDGTNSASTTFTTTESLRIWADTGSYVSSSKDGRILESWVVSSAMSPGNSVTFDLCIDGISTPEGKNPVYNVYLAVAVDDPARARIF